MFPFFTSIVDVIFGKAFIHCELLLNDYNLPVSLFWLYRSTVLEITPFYSLHWKCNNGTRTRIGALRTYSNE